MDSSRLFDETLVRFALCMEVRSIAIQNVRVFRIYIDMFEEIVPHVVVIALGM